MSEHDGKMPESDRDVTDVNRLHSVPAEGELPEYDRLNHTLFPRDQLDRDVGDLLANVTLGHARRARLLAACQRSDEGRDASGSADGSDSDGPVAIPREPHPTVRIRSRRGWLGYAAALLALSLTIGFVYWWALPGPWDHVGPQTLAAWTETHWQPRGRWRSFQYAEVESRYHLPRQLKQTPSRWQSIETDLDPEAGVFGFRGTHRNSRLYVLRVDQRLPRLPHLPPHQPQTQDDGRYVAAWQDDGFVYVLTIQGMTRGYWELMRVPSTSLANARRNAVR